MSDDDNFFQQFHEAPRPEFVEALYQRINKPMNAQKTQPKLRRTALTFAAAAAVLLAVVFSIPTTRAQAINLARQIGAFLIIDGPYDDGRTVEAPGASLPTALPPDPGKIVHVETIEDAAKAAGFTVLNPGNLPEGYAQQGGFSIGPNGSGMNVVTVYANPANDTFITLNQFKYAPGDAYVDNVTSLESLSDVIVRNHKAVWITDRYMTNPAHPEQSGEKYLRPAEWLVWEENGVVYTLMSDDLTLQQAVAIADSLK
jgi:hypothetical protein